MPAAFLRGSGAGEPQRHVLTLAGPAPKRAGTPACLPRPPAQVRLKWIPQPNSEGASTPTSPVGHPRAVDPGSVSREPGAADAHCPAAARLDEEDDVRADDRAWWERGLHAPEARPSRRAADSYRSSQPNTGERAVVKRHAAVAHRNASSVQVAQDRRAGYARRTGGLWTRRRSGRAAGRPAAVAGRGAGVFAAVGAVAAAQQRDNRDEGPDELCAQRARIVQAGGHAA